MKQITTSEINDVVWKACDTFRGAIDPSEYKNYILTMLFIKYMSDLHKDMKQEYCERYNNDMQRVERAMQRERFIMPETAQFDHLFKNREQENIGEIINSALEQIEEANKGKLDNVFRNIDFNSQPALGQKKERNRRLKNLLNDFNDERLDLRKSKIGNRDIIGDVYEYLISKFAAGAGKKAGEFYTPPEVSTVLAKLVDPKPGDYICDPACGSGSLLIKVAHEIHEKDYFLAGMESNGSTWSLCRMNMFLHNMDSARIEWCDTISNPKLIDDDRLMKFNVVVANPPFSLDKWGADDASADKFKRFWRGIPPKSKGDYAFITHMVETAHETDGRIAVVVPHGVLFRGSKERLIRKQFIEENILEAVIGLPAQLFYGTSIPSAVLVFNKARKKWDESDSQRDSHILFIDASREYEDCKKQNKLRTKDIDKIISTYKEFKEIEKYSHCASLEEIEEADFNLNISRYVDTFEEEEPVDISAVQKEIYKIEKELAETQEKMSGYLNELGF